MKTRLNCLWIALCIATLANAIPAKRGWQTRTQADGTTIEVQVIGDEYYHYAINRDGKQVREVNGMFEVVGEAPTSDQAKARRAKAVARRQRQGVGTTPNLAPKGVVILANFNDKSMQSSHTQAVFDELCNSLNCTVNSGYPSAGQYFADQSNGAYRPQFDVFGPVTLSRNVAYYGTDGDEEGDDQHATDAVVEACILANQQFTINWADYDSDNDGKVDFVYLIYAGKGQADGGSSETIWPHNWSVESARYYGNCTYTAAECKVGGKKLDNYACSSELSGNSLGGIGTLCHEFGHVMGLPDLYDIEYKTVYQNSVTPNDWNIMDGGSYNGNGHCPPNYDPWQKDFFGWLTPINLGNEGQLVTLYANGTENYQTYQINENGTYVSPITAGLRYYIENRQAQGWDAPLTGHGMLLWKVNFNANAWTSNAPNATSTSGAPLYTIVSATGTKVGWDGSKDNCPKNTFPGSGKKTSYTDINGKPLLDIKESNGIVTLTYIEEPDTTQDDVPSDAVLLNYFDQGDVCVCIHVPAEIACNDIVLTGAFNGWSSNAQDCQKFVPVEGYDGWYVASFLPESNPDSYKGIEAKPVILDAEGKFSWDYQVGSATAVRGGVQVVEGAYAGEIDLINYSVDAPNVLKVVAWKRNPCTLVYHNYTISVVSDGCDGNVVPFLIGAMNNWTFEQMQLDAEKTIANGNVPTYSISFKAAEGTPYQILSGLKNEAGEIAEQPIWADEAYIQKLVDNEWIRVPGEDGDNQLTHENTNIVWDLRAEDLRWARCALEDQLEYVLLAVNLPSEGAPAEGVEVIGSFDDWEGTAMELLDNGWWLAELDARASQCFKFRSAGSWDKELEMYDAMNDEWRAISDNDFIFGQLWSDDSWKGVDCKFIELDLSNPEIFRWSCLDCDIPVIYATCEEAAAAMPAENGEETEAVYVVTGYVTNTNGTISRGQQTFWMDDVKGSKKTLQGYWCNLPAEEVENQTPLNVGDKITLTGKIMNYRNTPEIKNGDVVILERALITVDTIDVSVCDAIEAGASLNPGEYSVDVFRVFGCLKDSDQVNNYGQHTFEMACGENILKPYNCKGEDGLALGQGDSVVVIGKLFNYNGTLEISNGRVELIKKRNYHLDVNWNETQGYVEIYQYSDISYLLMAYPNDGYEFVRWSDGVTDNPRWIELTQDIALTAEFEQKVEEQKCGDNLRWTLEDGVLTITGTGDMWNEQPWAASREQITQVNFPSELTGIGYYSFYGCSALTSLVIPKSVCEIGAGAFEDCRSVKTLTFEQGSRLRTIGSWAFYNCHNITSVEIPEGVTEIGKAVFFGCSYLAEVKLPASVQALGDNAFALCSKMVRMDLDALMPPTIAAKTFEDVSREMPVYVPDESVDLYKVHPLWGEMNIIGRSKAPQGIDNTAADTKVIKRIVNGLLIIERGNKTYTVTGQEIK